MDQLNKKIIRLNNRVNRIIFLLSLVVPLVSYSQSGSVPTDLNSTAPLTITENQPIGTFVGEFNATDLDINATLTYSLVAGAGDTQQLRSSLWIQMAHSDLLPCLITNQILRPIQYAYR
jgi:hypothetical protein